MLRALAENECLIQCGWAGYRREDGTVERTEPIYKIVKRDELDATMTRAEKECCDDIPAALGKKFGEYIRESKKAVKRRSK